MGSQGFRNIAGNPFVYQEDTRSAAFGLDAAAQTWKIAVLNTTGALPTSTAQIIIDPATNGNVTIDPNGSGNLVVSSGDVRLTAGNVGINGAANYIFFDGASSGQAFIYKKLVGKSTKVFLHSTGGANADYDQCCYLGHGAGESASATLRGNMIIGPQAAPSLTDAGGGFQGGYNTAIGGNVMLNASSAAFNIATGGGGANALTTGWQNCILGAYTAGYRLTTGSYNTIIGNTDQTIASDGRYWGAGYGYTGAESSNICINAVGTTGESNVLRIGTSGSSVGQVNKAFIAGIYGVSVGATNGLVYIDNASQLGSTNSPSVTGTYTTTGGNMALPASTSSSVGNVTWGGSKAMHTGETDGYFWGTGAGRYDTNTSRNIGIGTGACAYPYNNGASNGADNVCIGYQTLYDGGVTHYNTNVYQNVAIGNYALSHLNANCGNNTCVGYYAGHKIDASGGSNTLIGANAGYQLYMNPGVHGVEYTTALGYNAGGSWTADESSNIAINSPGVAGDNNILRIGNGSGTSGQQLNKAFIHGIYGRTPVGTMNVAIIDSNGQLGSTATLAPSLGGAMPWTEVTGTSQSAAVDNGYITNNVALVTVTLPTTAAVGQRVSIVGKGAGLWKLAQNSGQTIHFGSIDSTTGTGGYLSATVRYDCLEVICITANTDWVVRSSVGSITIV